VRLLSNDRIVGIVVVMSGDARLRSPILELPPSFRLATEAVVLNTARVAD
jgi:hypothetical protein